MNKMAETSIKSLMFDFQSKKSTLISLVNLIIFVVGVYGSFKVVLGLFGIEADTSHSLMLWHGMKEHGLVWVSDWLFTQDNWLLSLVPFHFIGFSIFGPKASVVIIFGWLIFIFSAFISGAIAWRLGAKKAAIFIFLVLLNLGLYAHSSGYVSYSTSHNITNLFGLASVLILINWFARPNNFLLVLLLLLLTSGAVSDPWMLASYNLPILLVGLWFMARPTEVISRNQSLKLITVAGISIVAVKTKLFGTLSFLPSMHFVVGEWSTLNSNSVYLIKDLGGLLNIIPFSGANAFLPSLLTVAVVGAVLLFSIFKNIRSWSYTNPATIAHFSFTLFSVGGIISAFVITSVEAMDYSARFLISSAYLIVITIGVLAERNWGNAGKSYRYVLVLILSLFFTSSLVSNFNYISNRDFKFKDTDVLGTISFLKENGLTYGYGPYWGSNANAVSAASMSRILIRPVVFNKNNGMMIVGNRPASSKRWYTDEDIPAGVNEFFVIVKSDGEECPDINICLTGLAKQFGQPIRSIKRDDSTILVWNHKLLGYELPALKLDKNKPYHFSDTAEIHPGKGWSVPESWGTWSDGSLAELYFAVPDDLHSIQIEANALISAKYPQQKVLVKINDELVQTVMLTQPSGNRIDITIPLALQEKIKKTGLLRLKFELPDAVSPKEIGMNEDGRKLALGLISITVQ